MREAGSGRRPPVKTILGVKANRREKAFEVEVSDTGMLELHLHHLTCKALDRFEQGDIGIRALSRKLKTSPSQVYRLLDTMNFKKSMDQMLRLLNALNVEVELVVRDTPIAPLSIPR